MMPPSMKTYLVLLWGISVLLSLESMSASISETSTVNSTSEPDEQMISAHSLHSESHKPTEVSVAAPSNTVETEEAAVADRSDSSNDSTSGLVAMGTVAATTSSSGLRLLHTSAAVTTAAGAAHPSHNTMISETAKPTGDQIHQQSHTTSVGTTAPATASAASSAAVAVSSLQPASTTKPDVPSELSSTTFPANSTQAPLLIQTISSPSASTATTKTANPTSEAAPVFDPAINETSTTSTELSSPSPVSMTTTPISTSPFPDSAGSSSATEPTTVSFSTDSPISSTDVSTTNISTTDVSTTNISTTDVSTTDVSTTDVFTTDVSTTPAGILVVPRATSRLPVPTTKSTPATTTAPRKVSKSPTSTEAQPCSTRGVVKNCLIIIASLAVLATVFMVSTIVLCTKLSTRKYKVKKPQPATEMMCISALLPERNYNYSRQRNPVTNGVLVIHGGADSDEDGGDNLTLSSFLPENDRFV